MGISKIQKNIGFLTLVLCPVLPGCTKSELKVTTVQGGNVVTPDGVQIEAGKKQTIDLQNMRAYFKAEALNEMGYLNLTYTDDLDDRMKREKNYDNEEALSECLNIVFVDAAGAAIPETDVHSDVLLDWQVSLRSVNDLAVVKIKDGTITSSHFNVYRNDDASYGVTFKTRDLNAYYGIVRKAPAPAVQEEPAKPEKKLIPGGILVAGALYKRKYFQTRSIVEIRSAKGFIANDEEYAILNADSNRVILASHFFGSPLVSENLDIRSSHHFFYLNQSKSHKWFKYGKNTLTFSVIRGNTDLRASQSFYLEDFSALAVNFKLPPPGDGQSSNFESWLNPLSESLLISKEEPSLLIEGLGNIISY